MLNFIEGLVLFHAKHIWINGTKTSGYQEDVEDLSPGRDVSFYHYQIEDDGYRNIISPDGTLRQAAAVWIGTRPAHLLKGNYIINEFAELKNSW
jgi:hypothetical protein